MVLEALAAFAAGILLGLSIAAPPGPMNALIASNTVTRSRLAGHLTGLGAMTADAIFLAVTVGVGSAIQPTRGFRILLYLLGAGVLFFLAARTYPLLRKGLEVRKMPGSEDPARAYLSGLLLGLTNPFQILWWLTAGLAFMTGIGPAVAAGFLLGIVTWIVAFPYTLDLASRRWKGTYRAVILASLVLLMVFGAYLAALAALAAG